MYFPYLHGMQAELQALTDAAADLGTPQQIFPLIEPVRSAPKLAKALDALKAESACAYVITNPHQGELASAPQVAAWAAALATHLADPAVVRPVFHERPATTVADLVAFFAAHPQRKTGVVLCSNRLDPAAVSKAIGSADTLVFLRHAASAGTYSPAIPAGRIVEIRPSFNVLARNSDYAGDEWFSADHLTYATSGRAGFSDYTVLADRYSSGGGPVGAAAFHLTFENPVDQHFWVQHFVSDETDRNVGTSSTKLLEAMAHLAAQLAVTPNRFEVSPALVSYQAQLATGRPTNLPKNKELQVRHHLYTVARHLKL